MARIRPDLAFFSPQSHITFERRVSFFATPRIWSTALCLVALSAKWARLAAGDQSFANPSTTLVTRCCHSCVRFIATGLFVPLIRPCTRNNKLKQMRRKSLDIKCDKCILSLVNLTHRSIRRSAGWETVAIGSPARHGSSLRKAIILPAPPNIRSVGRYRSESKDRLHP